MNDTAAGVYERLLILRCQTGDETALGELIARYSLAPRWYFRKMSGQIASPDDLLRDTWFDVYREINGLKRPDAFPAWLYRIARDKGPRWTPSLSPAKGNLLVWLTRFMRTDSDHNLAFQPLEKFQQFVRGEPAEMPAHQM